ncbi:hypothetical protein [Hyphococcus sp.]|uniref:hypothetical protein n=2 Tax=Hyphococcus sp. TaxID=2038636 RepID=UPI0035C6A866
MQAKSPISTIVGNSAKKVQTASAGAFWLIIFASAAIILAGQAYAALHKGINWDEFFHYDLIRRMAAGTLTSTLQTFFTHFFQWLPLLPGDVTDHIRTARIVMLACTAGAALALFGVARCFASDKAAAVAALAYLSGGFVVSHSAALRYDPMAALLLMGALWLLASRPLRAPSIIAFGALVGLAAMITIKVVIYAPVFAGVAWMRWRESKNKGLFMRRLVASALAGLAVFACLYAWHSTFVAVAPVSADVQTVESAGRVMFSEGFIPQRNALVIQIIRAPHVLLLVFFTFWLLPKASLSSARKVALLGMLAPLVSVLIYRNSYPYFYVFLLPPLLAATTPIMDVALKRSGMAILAGLMVVVSVMISFSEASSGYRILQGQKRTIAAAHALFPEPVSYFDFAGMLGDYDRALNFMRSGWGLKNYRRRGIARFAKEMEHKTIPLLIANHEVFTRIISDKEIRSEENLDLFEEDAEALREGYIHHWGLLWVAGRHIPPGHEPLRVNIRIPGFYTLEDSSLRIDGFVHQPGELIMLERGHHLIEGRNAPATLRWGDHLSTPSATAPGTNPFQPLY